ncbi:MAG: winged helix-turn-helix domain-containing protein [Candidatus Omnitrophota bacterium]
MINDIGIIAGEIWHFLDEHGKTKLTQIVKELNRPKELVLMSLGWLAREGHVKIEGKKIFTISLVNEAHPGSL